MKYRTLYAYYGGKTRLQKVICQTLRRVPNWRDLEFREPFLGGGSVGINFLRPGMSCWLNDADRGVACVWTAVMRYPAELCALVERLPSHDNKTFQAFHAELPFASDPLKATKQELLGAAISKLYFQRHAFSGKSANASMRDSTNRECWRKPSITALIWYHHKRFQHLRCRHQACTALDFSDVLKEDGEALFYLDPPYVGAQLGYGTDFAPHQHVLLARLLRIEERPWLLSYDDNEWVRDTYARFSHNRLDTIYPSIYVSRNDACAQELLIANFLTS